MRAFLSLGAGVQSTTLALVAAEGLVEPMPEAAIFADTKAEPRAVYEHLELLRAPGVLPFPVHVVSAGDLGETIGKPWATGNNFNIPIPLFTRGEREGGQIARSCTRDFKIRPVRRAIREALGIAGKRSPKELLAEQWIGISTDEAHRMKPTGESWLANRWPLIELGMSRDQCLAWLSSRGWTAPKSSCTFCPFRDDWLSLTPYEFEAACKIDERVRQLLSHKGLELFLHRKRVPLREVDLSKEPSLFDLFGNECEGVCGV